MDFGDYLGYADMSFTVGTSPYVSMSVMRRYLEKSYFPQQKLLAGFEQMKTKFVTKEEDAFCLQFASSILQVSSMTYGLYQLTDSNFDKGEILQITYDGFYTWKKGLKGIMFKPQSINFSDSNSGRNLYESQDYLKSVKLVYNPKDSQYYFLVCDEMKYVKNILATVDSNNKKIFTLKNDYYVNSDFVGNTSDYCMTNNMLYQKFQSYLCQEKGEETEDLALLCEPDDLGLDQDLMDDIYPVASNNWLMFYGPTETDDPNNKQYEALLLPEYNQPKVPLVNPNDLIHYKAEFFYYHDDEYIVYLKQSKNSAFVIIEIFKRNGYPHQAIELKINGCHDHQYANLLLSPSGRYLMYVEDVPDNNDQKVSEVEAQSKEANSAVGKIVELYMDTNTKVFKLKEKRKIPGFKERYNNTTLEFNTDVSIKNRTTIYFLTDKMEILVINKTDNWIMYEEIKVQDELKEKFGKNEYDKERFNTLNDINVVPKNGGIALYTQEEVFFLGIDSEARVIKPMIRCNFKINKGQMTVSKICPCTDPKLIIIALIKGYTENLLVVWDIEKNLEVFNFSTTETWSFMNGPDNKAGFILNGDTYVNMDKGLINYFFEYKFQTGIYDQVCGYRINKHQDIILESGNAITKETLIEVTSVDDIKDEVTTITNDNINLERVRFQVDGNTSLHYFALDYDTLTLITDYMEEHRPEYLTSILMKNNRGKSPLDITLDNESPKNTEVLLRKLALFRDSSLSILFYDRFSELLSMNITAFHEYLDSCFFQTVQMKATKYLKLKKDKDPWLVPHSSCLIDEVFIEKYCKSDEKKQMEKEKKKKEEEDKLKEEQKKVEEEQKRIDEENKALNGPEEEKDGNAPGNKDSMMDRNSDDDLLDIDDTITKKPKTKEELELEKERRKQKRLDIRAIEFDWIFNKNEGAAFMQTLALTDCIDLFSLTLVRSIIRFCWSYFRIYIVVYLFIPYIVYFMLFIFYATYVHKRAFERNDDEWKDFGLGNNICVILLLIFVCYFTYFEIKQIIFHKLGYFFSFWNMIDLVSLILNVIILISDLAGLKEEDMIPLLS